MLHCPFCGGKIKEEEIFCTQCGEKIPEDIYDRMSKDKLNNKLWYIPIILIFAILISVGSYYIYLEKQEKEAKQLYKQGEELALEEDYQNAFKKFKEAIKNKANFPSAKAAETFMGIAIEIETNLEKAIEFNKSQDYQSSLNLISESENKVKIYNGDVVNLLVNHVVSVRKDTLLQQLNSKLEKKPPINELKNLLWDAEAIKSEQGNAIANDIREQIVAYTYSGASEELKEKHFSNARNMVDDGLKYAPESEKLQSLKTTIEKEKTAFETAQEQRIEQAMIAVEEERKLNKNDAVELINVDVVKEENNLVVSGKIKSVATVPINSISVEYMLFDEDDNKILSNEIFVYPDTLFPDEEGKFDFTHFDVGKEQKNIKVKIEKIKWFLDE